MGLQYCSPFVGMTWRTASYKKVLLHLKDYLAMEATADMEYVADWNGGGVMPVLRFAGDEEVCAYAPHAVSAEDMLEKWNRRKERFNWNFFLVKMQIFTREDLHWFQSFQTPHKVGFCGFTQSGEDIVKIPAWELPEERMKFSYRILSMVHETIPEVYPAKATEFSYDIFKLLCGEKDYNRFG